ncbi:MAG: insulinase family protein [Chitinivibrionia bacterium]|nr:insulinase family protein [Chitinivibrionia bacterium]
MKTILFFLAVTIMFSQQAGSSVVKKVLPNGLTVLVKEDHSNPIVAVNIWFDVGSVNETEQMTGLAHFQEHMVFKGTETYGVGDIAKTVKAAGGNLNAGTSYSYTMYYIVLPSKSFPLALAVQADAMMHSTFDEGEFKKERIVVIDEARMYDDTPDAYVYYRTMELGFDSHNYRRPIAGYEKVVRKIKRDQLLDFYSTYYRPSNAVLVVVGDIEPDKAFKEVEAVYGKWEHKPADIYEPPAETPQQTFRFKEFRGEIESAYLGMGFHIPNIKHEDYPALEVLATLLSSGKSSRLFRNVQENKRLVTTINAGVLAEKWPGYFQIFASMPAEKWEDARDAIFDELHAFQKEPCSPEELIKARRQLEKSIYAELETMEGQASNLGYYELLGDYRLGDWYREAIKNVTPDQITSVAGKYFDLDNCSLVAYLPNTWSGTGYTKESVEQKLLSRLSPAGAVPAEAFAAGSTDEVAIDPATAKAAGRAKAVKHGNVKLITMDNGLRILVKRRETVPLVTMLTMLQGGTRLESAGKSGLSTLTLRALLKGTASYSAEEIARTIEELGGNIETLSSFDVAGVYTSVLSENLDATLPVYREVVRDPLFLPEEIEKEKGKLLEEIAQRHDNPIMYSIDSLFIDVFGNHPYSHPFLGDEDQLKSLTSQDCRNWYGSVMVPGNIVLTFVGDIPASKAREIAEKLFGDLKPGPLPSPAAAIPDAPARTGIREMKRKQLKQSMALVGFLAPPMMSSEAISLEVLNGLLTGLGGRLFVELRDKRSLGYMAGSAFIPLKDRSIFLGYANPTADGVDEALKVIMDELTKVSRDGVEDEEIARSKEWLIGSHFMQLQRNFSQAIAYGTYESLGFGYAVIDKSPELIRKVTQKDISEAASRLFQEEKAVLLKLVPDEEKSAEKEVEGE